jgi:NAD(P)H dehydrogenase (quinone)
MEKIIITGATGQLGNGVVIELLKKTDAKNISVVVRDPQKAESFKKAGITILKGDYMDYNSLVEAFTGQEKLFFISSSDLNEREKQQENVVKAAIEAKIKHIIYTSFQRKNETESSPIWMLASAHIATEKMIKASGLTYTILKNGLYADFLPTLLGNTITETGTIYLPAGDGKAAFTLRSDLAEGSAEIIIGKGHENKTYEFASDHAYTFTEIASYLSEITGHKISYISPAVDEYKAALAKAGVPEIYIGMFTGSATAIKQGEFALEDNTLSKILGRKCTNLKELLNQVYKK